MDRKYTLLFNAITDAITALEMLKDFLVAAQQQAEAPQYYTTSAFVMEEKTENNKNATE